MELSVNEPLEAVRLATLLSAGALVLSERSAPADEAEYANIVDFASVDQMPERFLEIVRLDAAQRETERKAGARAQCSLSR